MQPEKARDSYTGKNPAKATAYEKINSLYSAIYSKVKKINYEKRDCYLIQDFGQEIVVEANTGNIIRMVSSLPEEQTTTFEYFREFDTVQDSDIIRPETTDYMEK